jgi:predicted XRE-type DNA-binding protein
MTGGKNEKIKVKVTMSSVTVVADIGLPNAAEHSIKADLVMAIAARIKSRGLTQVEAASLLGCLNPTFPNFCAAIILPLASLRPWSV